jgi:uncharacterized protein
MKKILLFIFLAILIFEKVNSQSNGVPKIPLKYGLIAKAYPDSIVLRWAPESANILPAHMDAGVWIEKLAVEGSYPYKLSKWERITSHPIKPASAESFNNEKSKKNENEMLVAQMLYGKLPSSFGKSEIGNVKENAEAVQSLFYMTLLGCDYSPTAAQKMGLRKMVSQSIKKDQKLFYRVYSAYTNPIFKVDTTFTFCTYGEWDADLAPKYLKTTSQEKAVELSWPYNKELNRWAGFNIERSSDGKSFTKLNKKPYMVMSELINSTVYYIDSVINYKPFFYRIEALDPFGESVGFSEVVKGFGRDFTPPDELNLVEKDLGGKSIELKWNFTSNTQRSDLKHFVIKRGKQINNIIDTVKIVNNFTFSYTDNYLAKTKSTYYEVVAVDTAGNARSSNPVRYFMADVVPPDAPKNFVAKIDQNGIVNLSWDIDTLEELVGYRVYRRNQKDHDAVCLQEGYLQTNFYSDTLALNTLTEEVYYSVSAIDLSYNHGKKSNEVKLMKPDVIAPFPPLIKDYKVSNGSVYLQWVPSPSKDVVVYILQRKNINQSKIDWSKELSKEQINYTDKEVKNGEMYEYSLVAIDEVKLRSEPSFPLTVKAYAPEKIAPPVLKWIEKDNKLGFEWQSQGTKPMFYIIYKDDGNGLVQYKNAQPNDTQFFENKPTRNAKIKYGLQAVYADQNKSELTMLDWKTIN